MPPHGVSPASLSPTGLTAARSMPTTPATSHPAPPDSWWAPAPPRDTLLVTGRDAVRFVDNFQTAAAARLAFNAGSEAFFTDGRGWVICLANILRLDDVEEDGTSLWIDLPAGMAGRLHDHLEHYHIREDVGFRDVSVERAGLLIGGPAAAAWLAAGAGAGPRLSAEPPPERLGHRTARLGGIPVRVVQSDWFGPGTLRLISAASDHPRLMTWLAGTGLTAIDAGALEESRILAGNPEPADIPEKTLPQELGRDARAICFTKGCYLGQETVARLDALGHVNRRLVTLAIEGDVPQPPAVVMSAAGGSSAGGAPEGVVVGTMTSACHSPRLGCGIGLAVMQAKPLGEVQDGGLQLTVAGAPARVVGPFREDSV
jgi:folate-binding protein YgfZ